MARLSFGVVHSVHRPMGPYIGNGVLRLYNAHCRRNLGRSDKIHSFAARLQPTEAERERELHVRSSLCEDDLSLVIKTTLYSTLIASISLVEGRQWAGCCVVIIVVVEVACRSGFPSGTGTVHVPVDCSW